MAARNPHKLDSRYSWLVCLAAAISNGMAHSVVFSFGVLLPIFMKEFHETRERTALIGSLTYGLAYLTTLAAGQVSHQFGCRLCHIIGTLLCAVSLFASSWATNMTFLFLTFCPFYGLGLSMTFMPCFLVVTLYFKRRRSMALGIVTAGASAAFFVIGPLMEALVESIGWRNTLRAFSGILVCTSFMSISFDPNVESPSLNKQTSPESSNESVVELSNTSTTWKKILETFSFCKAPGYIFPALSLSIVSFSHCSVPIHLVRHCEEMGISSKRSSYLYLGIGIGSLVSRIGAGKLCEIIRPVYINQIGDVCSGICTLGLALTSSYPFLVFITLMYGLADGTFYTTLNVLLNSVKPEQRPFAYGSAGVAISFAVTFGPMITGLVADHHSYKEALLMAGCITIIGGLLPFFLFCFKEVEHKQQSVAVEQLLIYEKETVI